MLAINCATIRTSKGPAHTHAPLADDSGKSILWVWTPVVLHGRTHSVWGTAHPRVQSPLPPGGHPRRESALPRCVARLLPGLALVCLLTLWCADCCPLAAGNHDFSTSTELQAHGEFAPSHTHQTWCWRTTVVVFHSFFYETHS